jgi:HK97 family phage prohead protease
MERRFYQAEFKETDNKAMIIRGWIATEEKDRAGDILRADGMKINGKPTLLFAHGFGQSGQEPIGRPLSIKKAERGKLRGVEAELQFFPDKVGKRLFEKVKGEYIHSLSVGFMVNKANQLPDGGREVTDWDLLEISLTGVPVNPSAQIAERGEYEGFEFKILSDQEVSRQLTEGIITIKKDGRVLTVKEIIEEVRGEACSWVWSLVLEEKGKLG